MNKIKKSLNEQNKINDMEETIKRDLISVLKSTSESLKQQSPDIPYLRDISNHTIHNASIFQDEDSISIAILIYSLSKLIERSGENINYNRISTLLELAIEHLEKDNIEKYEASIKQIFSIISKTDTKFRLYVQEVIRQASVRKGSKLYEHGISASKTASILGISLWDLYQYLGAKNIPEHGTSISSVRQRLEFTRRLFS